MSREREEKERKGRERGKEKKRRGKVTEVEEVDGGESRRGSKKGEGERVRWRERRWRGM